MKLDTTLFNAVLEQVRHQGPDLDAKIEDGTLEAENEFYMDFLYKSTAYVVLNPTAAIAAAFQIGMETAFQYAKVSQEVKQLNKLI